MKSTDDGKSWNEVNSGLDNKIVKTLSIDSKGEFFAGARGHICISKNDGESWSEIDTGLNNEDFNQIIITPDDTIYVLTPSYIYKSNKVLKIKKSVW